MSEKVTFISRNDRENAVKAWITINIERDCNIIVHNDIISVIIRFANDADFINIMVIGEERAGKSTLCLRYITGKYLTNSDPFEDYEYTKEVVIDDTEIFLRIQDTMDYKEHTVMYYDMIRPHKIILLCYSMTQGLHNVKDYISNIEPNDKQWIILVGTQCDDINRQVSYDEGKALANELKCQFIETSAKDDINVNQAFENIVAQYIREAKLTEVKSHDWVPTLIMGFCCIGMFVIGILLFIGVFKAHIGVRIGIGILCILLCYVVLCIGCTWNVSDNKNNAH